MGEITNRWSGHVDCSARCRLTRVASRAIVRYASLEADCSHPFALCQVRPPYSPKY